MSWGGSDVFLATTKPLPPTDRSRAARFTLSRGRQLGTSKSNRCSGVGGRHPLPVPTANAHRNIGDDSGRRTGSCSAAAVTAVAAAAAADITRFGLFFFFLLSFPLAPARRTRTSSPPPRDECTDRSATAATETIVVRFWSHRHTRTGCGGEVGRDTGSCLDYPSNGIHQRIRFPVLTRWTSRPFSFIFAFTGCRRHGERSDKKTSTADRSSPVSATIAPFRIGSLRQNTGKISKTATGRPTTTRAVRDRHSSSPKYKRFCYVNNISQINH